MKNIAESFFDNNFYLLNFNQIELQIFHAFDEILLKFINTYILNLDGSDYFDGKYISVLSKFKIKNRILKFGAFFYNIKLIIPFFYPC